MPWGSTEEPEVEFSESATIPVHVVSTDARPEKSLAPEFGRWRTFRVTSAVGNDLAVPGAQRIANRSLRRHRLLIIVNASVAAQTVTDGVIIGGREEIAALAASNTPLATYTPGGYLAIGNNVRYESQQELWAAYPPSNIAPVIVTVCDETYASGLKVAE
jgi:hypothetical protein